MGSSKTEVVNITQQALHMCVTNRRLCAELARIERGLTHTMEVDCSDTYMEYSMGPDPSGNTLILSSDDLWDYKRITITEVHGRFDVRKEFRFLHGSEKIEAEDDPVAKEQRVRPSWKRWIRLGLLL